MKLISWCCLLSFSISLVYIQTLEKREYYQWEFDIKKGIRRRRKWSLDERLVLTPKLFAELVNEMFKLLLINREVYHNIFVTGGFKPLNSMESITDFFVTGNRVEHSKNEFINVLFYNDDQNEDEYQTH